MTGFSLIFTDDYNKRATRFLRTHKELHKQYSKVIELLESNPFHPSLKLHGLNGKLQGLHAVWINQSYRITLELLIIDKQIVPINVGDHLTVYGNK